MTYDKVVISVKTGRIWLYENKNDEHASKHFDLKSDDSIFQIEGDK